MLWRRHEPELAGVGRHAGDEDAPRLEQRLERRRVDAPSRHLHQRVDGDRPAVDDDQRVEVGAHDRRVGLGGRPTAPTSTSTSASRSTAGSPRNSPSSAWVARSSIISAASSRVIGTRRKATSASASARIAADAEHHRHAELLVVVQPGDQLAVAAQHRRDEQVHLTVLGPGRGQQVARPPPRTASSSASAEAHEAALGLVGDARRRPA